MTDWIPDVVDLAHPELSAVRSTRPYLASFEVDSWRWVTLTSRSVSLTAQLIQLETSCSPIPSSPSSSPLDRSSTPNEEAVSFSLLSMKL